MKIKDELILRKKLAFGRFFLITEKLFVYAQMSYPDCCSCCANPVMTENINIMLLDTVCFTKPF